MQDVFLCYKTARPSGVRAVQDYGNAGQNADNSEALTRARNGAEFSEFSEPIKRGIIGIFGTL